jgi:hypothetical protein
VIQKKKTEKVPDVITWFTFHTQKIAKPSFCILQFLINVKKVIVVENVREWKTNTAKI